VRPVAKAARRSLPRKVDAVRNAEPLRTAASSNGAWGHFTRRHALALVFMREHVSAFRDLEKGPWACLQTIAVHWQGGRRRAYPGQERLSMLSGYDVRSIRAFVKALESRGFVHVVRLKVADGTARLLYEPGALLLSAVDQFDRHYTDDRSTLSEAPPNARNGFRPDHTQLSTATKDAAEKSEHVGRAVKHARSRFPPNAPEMASAGPAAIASGELPDLRELLNSSSFLAAASGIGTDQEEDLNGSEIDREVAREALAELRKRRFGCVAGQFDTKDVAMAFACASAVDGDRETKTRAQLDAIAHAFEVSRGNPTPRYIWGSIDHFLEHAASGRIARLEHDKARARRERALEAEREGAREHSRRERERCRMPLEARSLVEQLQRGCSRHAPSHLLQASTSVVPNASAAGP
jgi:hypothetical protein